jgi:hypothetical protein
MLFMCFAQQNEINWLVFYNLEGEYILRFSQLSEDDYIPLGQQIVFTTNHLRTFEEYYSEG